LQVSGSVVNSRTEYRAGNIFLLLKKSVIANEDMTSTLWLEQLHRGRDGNGKGGKGRGSREGKGREIP
jgi:hypothetical protein